MSVAQPNTTQPSAASAVAGQETLYLLITTPGDTLFEGNARWAQVPLRDGLIGIWPGHAPLVGALGPGEVEFAVDDEMRRVAVQTGILKVDHDRCVVLVGAQAASYASQKLTTDQLAAQMEAGLEAVLTPEELEQLQRSGDAPGD